jgi:hypothetical protein
LLQKSVPPPRLKIAPRQCRQFCAFIHLRLVCSKQFLDAR